MDELDYFPILDENDVKQRSIFTVNNCIQVVFITDLKTGKKLDDDYNVNEYLQAVVQANLLKSNGISDPKQIFTITRSDEIDDDKTTVVISLDVVTNIQDGVDELRCSISEEGLYSESEELPEDSPIWNRQVPELPESESFDSLGLLPEVAQGPTLRWNSEMTTQLINIRGNMDREFAQAKYKFRLWEQVAVKLNEILTYVKVTAKDCDDKWRNIVATYRKNIDKIKCCGDNTVRWEYFTAMDNILKGTKELHMGTEIHLNSDEGLTELMRTLDPSEVEMSGTPIDLISVSDESSPVEEIELYDVDEALQDCIITRKFNGEKRRWTTEQCLLLIYLRKEMESKFKKSYDRVPNLWREIASQMNINFLSDFIHSELEAVWNHCNITYEVNLEILKSKGVDTINWRYFAVMDELRGGTREIAELCVPRPGECLLAEFQKLSQQQPTLSPHVDTSRCSTKYETDSEDASPFSPTGVVWTQEMVKILISLKKVIEHDIARHKISRKKQWGILVRRFRTLKNVKVTEEACEEKWRNLVRTYKKNLVRVRKRGMGVIRWPYFWRIHEILGNVIENEKLPSDPTANKYKLIETVEVAPNHVSTYPLTEQLVVESQDEAAVDKSPTTNSYQGDVSNIMNELRNMQNKIYHEIIDRQNERIEELHREQLNIKTLLTQLLQKFP